jgi:hypothetical protein
MEGVWFWTENEREQIKLLERLKKLDLIKILVLLAKSKDGLSNSEINNMINNNSQWRTIWDLRQLLSLGFVAYKIDLFGDPGRYQITELGKTILQTMTN